MRLDKYLHLATGLSRSRAKKAIRDGRVMAGWEIIRDPAIHIALDARVLIDDSVATLPGPRFFMLNKPPDVICATSDPSHRTVLDLLPPDEVAGLVVAGRLDIDATGLVLLAGDGQWVHRITAPRHKQPKGYRVTLAEPLGPGAEHQLERGIFLKGEDRRTLPAGLKRLSPTEVRITLVEGRYHQVKRMFAALGNRVIRLHRERIGPLMLDPALAPGEFRRLSEEEISAF